MTNKEKARRMVSILFHSLKHGDQKHQEWLQTKLEVEGIDLIEHELNLAWSDGYNTGFKEAW